MTLHLKRIDTRQAIHNKNLFRFANARDNRLSRRVFRFANARDNRLSRRIAFYNACDDYFDRWKSLPPNSILECVWIKSGVNYVEKDPWLWI